MACQQQQQSDEPASENSVPEASSSSGILGVQYFLLMSKIEHYLKILNMLSVFLTNVCEYTFACYVRSTASQFLSCSQI